MDSPDDNVQRLHQHSLDILDTIGIRFASEQALDIAREYGCRVANDVVRFAPDQIMELVEKAPSEFMLEAKNPAHSVQIGGGSMVFLAGYGAPVVMDFDGNIEAANTEDYLNFLKLVEVHDHFHINGGVLVQPENLPAEYATAMMLTATLRHSEKGLLVANAHGKELDLVFEILESRFGKELQTKICVMTLINSLSPLQYDGHALENCIRYAEKGQALIITGGALIGATGALSLAASFAQANAETLAGIALAQMVRPGSPVVYGMLSSISDMATGTAAIGCPEKALATKWNGKLAAFYKLPCRAGGTDNDAQAVNFQAGVESMFTMGATMASKTNLVLHSVGMLASYGAISYEKFIIDLDILSMLKVYEQDIEVSEEALAFDVMKEVGIGGQFLTHPHTFAHCRDTLWSPKVGIRRLSKDIDVSGELKTRIIKEKNRLMAIYNRPELEPHFLERLAEILKRYDLNYDTFFPATISCLID